MCIPAMSKPEKPEKTISICWTIMLVDWVIILFSQVDLISLAKTLAELQASAVIKPCEDTLTQIFEIQTVETSDEQVHLAKRGKRTQQDEVSSYKPHIKREQEAQTEPRRSTRPPKVKIEKDYYYNDIPSPDGPSQSKKARKANAQNMGQQQGRQPVRQNSIKTEVPPNAPPQSPPSSLQPPVYYSNTVRPGPNDRTPIYVDAKGDQVLVEHIQAVGPRVEYPKIPVGKSTAASQGRKRH